MAMTKTKRRRRHTSPQEDHGAVFMRLMQEQLHKRQSDAAFLSTMRARQRAGQLKNPAVTGPLLDRLERAIA